MSLKLDSTYVKAYQRRAVAREALNKLEEAEADLLKVLELEPNNKESRQALDNLTKKLNKSKDVTSARPVSKFTATRNLKSGLTTPNNLTTIKHIESNQETEPYWPSGDDCIILSKAIKKPVHMRSKKSLKRINIEEMIDEKRELVEAVKETVFEKHEPIISKPLDLTSLKTDDLKIIERKNDLDISNTNKETKNITNATRANTPDIKWIVPKTSVQFYSQWRHLKSIENKYSYLKLIKAQDLPSIFKESLDSTVFSDILSILANCYIQHNDVVFDFVSALTKTKRFSTFTMFMSHEDKKCKYIITREYIIYCIRLRSKIPFKWGKGKSN